MTGMNLKQLKGLNMDCEFIKRSLEYVLDMKAIHKLRTY